MDGRNPRDQDDKINVGRRFNNEGVKDDVRGILGKGSHSEKRLAESRGMRSVVVGNVEESQTSEIGLAKKRKVADTLQRLKRLEDGDSYMSCFRSFRRNADFPSLVLVNTMVCCLRVLRVHSTVPFTWLRKEIHSVVLVYVRVYDGREFRPRV
ncbi:hypothetical protein CBR_g25737 [Chara braunii]|uniref:Uncharacterized protein n=1 Tax=Chara braunii TaxID=69332 RepID=A0A388L676_CHABU|nr:hypothetical protein CBR_g75394 [Chara braunii]GBG77806.1 hypothetical protein CBR_g25737 [Chara braunii]|eukprot:GBG42032.1 hypothetical protein CBR_g75394 [Chara braunii]